MWGEGEDPSPTAPWALPPGAPREISSCRYPDHALGAAEPEELRREPVGGGGWGGEEDRKVVAREMFGYRKEKSAYS